MSDITLTLGWKVNTVLKTWPPINKENNVFAISPNTGFLSQFSLPLNLCYVPQVLSPTITFHQVIKNLLKQRLDIVVEDKKFPYKLFVPNLNAELSLNLQIRLFQPNILSLTVSVSDFPANLDVVKLIGLQRLEHLRPISDIVQWTIGMTETLNHRDFDTLAGFRYKPALFLNGVSSPEQFPNHVGQNYAKYVGILIRNDSYELMSNEITNRIIEKNKNHNLKSSQELLLIDKQGILFISPVNSTNSKSLKLKFLKTHDLYEVAFVYDTFLKNYRTIRAYNEDFADFLYYRVQIWINEPEVVFSNSVTNKHIWNLLMREFGLKSSLRSVTDNTILSAITEKSKYFDQFSVNWWNEKDFVYLLEKTIEESKGLQLEFLENEDLKRLIIEDYGEAKRCFQSRNYKATMLLCGSIAEAILTAVIDKANLPNIDTSKLYNDFDLNKLIVTAKSHNLITDKNLFSLLDPIRHYRNIIHPGVQIRKSVSPDFSKARIALDTLNLLIKDLSKSWEKKSP